MESHSASTSEVAVTTAVYVQLSGSLWSTSMQWKDLLVPGQLLGTVPEIPEQFEPIGH